MHLSELIQRAEKKFAEDDYDWVNENFFAQLRKSRDVASDISGWMDTYSRVQETFPSQWPEFPDLQTYRVDDGNSLKVKKEPLLSLLSAWEARDVGYDDVTLCGSATAGSLITLAVLSNLGIKTVVFETPAYYATLDQAKLLGMRAVRVPTYVSEGFQFHIDRSRFPAAPLAIWVTHPRVSLGLNQNKTECIAILNSLRPTDYLVIDEATEQHFPALLSCLAHDPRVIRIRNIFKPMGLNGPRLCVIFHSKQIRQQMELYTVTCSGPLDCFSLELAVQAAASPIEFQMMLGIANQQTTQLRRDVERVLRGSEASVSELVNGYIGCAVLDFTRRRGSHADNRTALFEFCRSVKMPVIVGSQMSFAFDPNHEFVRVNYFTRRSQIMAGALLLRDFARRDELGKDGAEVP